MMLVSSLLLLYTSNALGYSTGYIENTVSTKTQILPRYSVTLRTLPRGFLGWATEAQDQRDCGSCYAFTAVAVAEGNYMKAAGASPVMATSTSVIVSANAPAANFSEQQLVSCGRSYDPDSLLGCGGGDFFGLSYIQTVGLVSEKYYPYVMSATTCQVPTVPVTKFMKWGLVDPQLQDNALLGRLCHSVEVDKSVIKLALMEYGSLFTVFTCPAADSFQNYKNGVFSQAAGCGGSHAVTLVGWDDTMVDRYGNQGAWFLKNSWGKGWGIQGFFWASYANNPVIGRCAAFIDGPVDCTAYFPNSNYAQQPLTGLSSRSYTVSCNAGYSGSGTVKCQTNGFFTTLTCTLAKSIEDGNMLSTTPAMGTASGTSFPVVPTVVGAVVGILILIAIIMISCYWVRRRSNQSKLVEITLIGFEDPDTSFECRACVPTPAVVDHSEVATTTRVIEPWCAMQSI